MRSLIQENLFGKSLAQRINGGKRHAREFIVDKLNEITDTREFTRGKLQENLFGTSLAEKIYLMQENLLWGS